LAVDSCPTSAKVNPALIREELPSTSPLQRGARRKWHEEIETVGNDFNGAAGL
jgi:hypothetical protein